MNENLLLELIEEIKDYEKKIYGPHSSERYWKEIQMDVSLYLLAWDDFRTQQFKKQIFFEKDFSKYEFKKFIPLEQTSILYLPFVKL